MLAINIFKIKEQTTLTFTRIYLTTYKNVIIFIILIIVLHGHKISIPCSSIMLVHLFYIPLILLLDFFLILSNSHICHWIKLIMKQLKFKMAVSIVSMQYFQDYLLALDRKMLLHYSLIKTINKILLLETVLEVQYRLLLI